MSWYWNCELTTLEPNKHSSVNAFLLEGYRLTLHKCVTMHLASFCYQFSKCDKKNSHYIQANFTCRNEPQTTAIRCTYSKMQIKLKLSILIEKSGNEVNAVTCSLTRTRSAHVHCSSLISSTSPINVQITHFRNQPQTFYHIFDVRTANTSSSWHLN